MHKFWRLSGFSLCLIKGDDLVHVEIAHEYWQLRVVPDLTSWLPGLRDQDRYPEEFMEGGEKRLQQLLVFIHT